MSPLRLGLLPLAAAAALAVVLLNLPRPPASDPGLFPSEVAIFAGQILGSEGWLPFFDGGTGGRADDELADFVGGLWNQSDV